MKDICFKIIVGFIVIMIFYFIACNSEEKKIEPYSLCLKFYEMNKNKKLNSLFNVQILGLREFSEYDDKSRKYNRLTRIIGITDSISGENIKIPVFIKSANYKEKEMMFNRCDSSCIMFLKKKYKIDSYIDTDIFSSYIKEVELIYSEYYQIEIPDILPYTNIEVNGCGNYIEFILFKDERKRSEYKCFYVRDTIFSNTRLKEYFDKLPQFDENWFYDIGNVSN